MIIGFLDGTLALRWSHSQKNVAHGTAQSKLRQRFSVFQDPIMKLENGPPTLGQRAQNKERLSLQGLEASTLAVMASCSGASMEPAFNV